LGRLLRLPGLLKGRCTLPRMAALGSCGVAAGGADIHSFVHAMADLPCQTWAAGARLCPLELEWAGWRGGIAGPAPLYDKQPVAAGEARAGGRAGDSRKAKPSTL